MTPGYIDPPPPATARELVEGFVFGVATGAILLGVVWGAWMAFTPSPTEGPYLPRQECVCKDVTPRGKR